MSESDVTPAGDVSPEAQSNSGSTEPTPPSGDEKEAAGRALRRGLRLPWPPPGLEWAQGKLWKVITLAWIGALVLVGPLLYSLGVEPDFWSLGPLEANWELGLAVAAVGTILLISAMVQLFSLARSAGRAARQGYGFLTIVEAVCDVGRDTGFLLMGKRHFQRFTSGHRAALARRRMWGALLLLIAAIWLAVGFSLSVLLASRGIVGARDTWYLTVSPSAIFLVLGGFLYFVPAFRIRLARRWWVAEEGGDERVRSEAENWLGVLDGATDEDFVMGGGDPAPSGLFRNGAILVALVSLVIFVPTLTVAFSAAVGPILAEIALPQFLSVQEMSGAAEALRRYQLPVTSDRSATEVGQALHVLEFVGSPVGAEEPHELAPVRPTPDHWFPNPDVFPDIFSEGVGRDLVLQLRSGLSAEDMAAVRQAAAHPAQAEFDVIATADRVDMVATRWVTPFADSLNVLSLPWPRFTELRYAALARISKGMVEQMNGRGEQAETTMKEVVSAGFLLVDNGPTLIDNLIGVVIANIGGDALEGLYELQGRTNDLETLRAVRETGLNAARAARTGIPDADIHTTLRAIPDIVTNDDALRGLRWEYFATFNILAPCINLHKMVFGPEGNYDDWLDDVRTSLVSVPGEAPLFDLAQAQISTGGQQGGFFAWLLRLTLGDQTRPGSCVNLITSAQVANLLG
jgi:hypothetical protein